MTSVKRHALKKFKNETKQRTATCPPLVDNNKNTSRKRGVFGIVDCDTL
jgi:hypothetical protein